MEKDTVLFDLDGTVADITHRLKYVQTPTPDWPRFFKECVNDVPKPWARELARALMFAGYRVVIVSARSRVVEQETRDWFIKHWGPGYMPEAIHLIRPDKDSTPDDKLKREWLYSWGLKDRVLFVVDDRQRVVDMWRAEGLTCLQCDKWEEYKRPRKSQVVQVCHEHDQENCASCESYRASCREALGKDQ